MRLGHTVTLASEGNRGHCLEKAHLNGIVLSLCGSICIVAAARCSHQAFAELTCRRTIASPYHAPPHWLQPKLVAAVRPMEEHAGRAGANGWLNHDLFGFDGDVAVSASP